MKLKTRTRIVLRNNDDLESKSGTTNLDVLDTYHMVVRKMHDILPNVEVKLKTGKRYLIAKQLVLTVEEVEVTKTKSFDDEGEQE